MKKKLGMSQFYRKSVSLTLDSFLNSSVDYNKTLQKNILGDSMASNRPQHFSHSMPFLPSSGTDRESQCADESQSD